MKLKIIFIMFVLCAAIMGQSHYPFISGTLDTAFTISKSKHKVIPLKYSEKDSLAPGDILYIGTDKLAHLLSAHKNAGKYIFFGASGDTVYGKTGIDSNGYYPLMSVGAADVAYSYSEADPVWASDSGNYASKFFVNSQGFLFATEFNDSISQHRTLLNIHTSGISALVQAIIDSSFYLRTDIDVVAGQVSIVNSARVADSISFTSGILANALAISFWVQDSVKIHDSLYQHRSGINILADSISLYSTGAIKLNANTIVQGDFTVSGDVVSGGTITGATVQTASSGQRIILDGTTNRIQFYSSTGNAGTIRGYYYGAAGTHVVEVSNTLYCLDGIVTEYNISAFGDAVITGDVIAAYFKPGDSVGTLGQVITSDGTNGGSWGTIGSSSMNATLPDDASITLVTGLRINSGTLQYTTQNVAVTNGILTTIGTESGWTNVPSGAY